MVHNKGSNGGADGGNGVCECKHTPQKSAKHTLTIVTLQGSITGVVYLVTPGKEP